MAFSLTWLPATLQAAGLKVAEVKGWQTRGHGDVGAIKGVICHHTAGGAKGNMPSLNVLINGRPGLPGPLAQLGLARDGTYFIIAAGRCNHAGKGNWQGFTSGNTNFIGIEAENTGLATDPWPDTQIEAYERGCAAILKKVKMDAIMAVGHREYALPPGRKSDPGFINMKTFRMHVAAIMAGQAPAVSVIPKVSGTGHATLRRGATGADVMLVQKAVGVAQSGTLDAATEAAIREFQRNHHLVPDGIVGPKSWSLIAP